MGRTETPDPLQDAPITLLTHMDRLIRVPVPDKTSTLRQNLDGSCFCLKTVINTVLEGIIRSRKIRRCEIPYLVEPKGRE
jgi:hypothetical protein